MNLAGVLKNAEALQTKIVVASPATGNRLYLDPAGFIPGPTPSASGQPGIEFPFSVTLSAGPVPTDGKSTDSISQFVAAERWTILRARGPYGLPWGAWLGLLLAAAVLPYLPLFVRGRK